MKRVFLLSLLALLCVPAPAEDKPAPSPAFQVKQLSADQKLQLREYQLRNSNAVAQVTQLQLEIQRLRAAQAENTSRMDAFIQDTLRQACGAPEKCTLDQETATVKVVPTPAPAPKSPAGK